MTSDELDLEEQIYRLYGVPLDEFVAARGRLAKDLRAAGDRASSDRIKALRKPTAGAWALNQAVRRRRSEAEGLLEAGERLRAAQEALLAGGGREELRAAMTAERALAARLADCAEVIASETGKSGPALKERVRSTLHAAALDEEVRDQLARGRVLREREAVGMGGLGPPPAAIAPATAPPDGAEARAEERQAAEAACSAARVALAEAEAAHAGAASGVEAAATALGQARATERAARKLLRERERALAKRERELAQLAD